MIRGIHHLGLTVRDVEASATWYEEVLGFRRVGDFEAADGARRKVFLRHDGLDARLRLAGLRSHEQPGGQHRPRQDGHRTGLRGHPAHPGDGHIWDAGTGKERRAPRGHARSLTSVAFSPNGK